MSDPTVDAPRLSIDEGPDLPAPETLPEPGSEGPRVGDTPVQLAGDHPVPDIQRPLHVVPADDGWLLRFAGSDTIAAVYPTKKEAMSAARALAHERDLQLVEHGADGRIRS
jgi:hypothetical protein